MDYANLTRHDTNLVKRFIQRRRLADAISLVPGDPRPGTIVDFGAGDGELCRQIATLDDSAEIFCYEPAEWLREQARQNLLGITNVSIVSRADQLPQAGCDVVFCLEVFEHLRERETLETLNIIAALLSTRGIAIIGVPIEIYAPALIKGLFRISRRHGHFDARLGNVLRATAGVPPKIRPAGEIASGLPYHKHHLGFDHRTLRTHIVTSFDLVRTKYSPIGMLGSWTNSEVSYVVRRRK